MDTQPTINNYKALLKQQAQGIRDELMGDSGANTPGARLEALQRAREENLGARATQEVASRPQDTQRDFLELAPLPDPVRLEVRDNPLARVGGMGEHYDPDMPVESQGQGLSQYGPITQGFGNRNAIERFSGGVNYGTDFGVPTGTKVALPAGSWEVVEAFGGADNNGFIGNNANRGYGNSVLVKNTKTGEMLRFSHLSRASVQPGSVVKGGSVIGLSGNSGNTTGAHLDLEYYTPQGQLSDVMRTPYGRSYSGKGGNGR